MKAIDEHEEWRLLIMVCPLFESNLCWTSTDSSHNSQVVVEETAGLLKFEIQFIKVKNPAGEFPSEDAYDDFVHTILALLSSLETLLDDAIENEECLQPGADINRYTKSLRRRCPRLVALDHLLRISSDQNRIAQMSRFVNLRQDACAFKRTKIDAVKFNHAMECLVSPHRSEGRTRVAKTAPTQRRSKISDPYCSQSRRLFDSLVAHVQPCTTKKSRHHAMIQLKHTDDQEHQEGNLSNLEFCMLFGSCPDQIGDWIQAHCASSPKDENEYAERVYDICQNARHARDNGQIFRVRLIEAQFLDVSDFDCMLRDPKAVPTVSLWNLLTNNILKDRYKFFPNDKKILAYTLSHALLNLHDNPWLQTLWTLDKIFFLQSHETGMLYNIHQPYVSCLLSTDAPPLETLDPLHNYPMVFSFAKLLWELETGEEMLPVKHNKNGQKSLWITLRHFCRTASIHQFSLGYSRALEACVNFPKYVKWEKETTQDLKMAEKQAILKYIVHELENDVDLTRKAEWGTRDLNLKLQITVRGQPFEVDAVQPIEKTQGNSGTQFKRKAPLASGQRPLKRRSGHGRNPREGVAEIHAEEPNSETEAGFGHMEFMSDTDSRPEISSKSFSYLHDVVSRYWQPCDKDEPIRVAVLDTGFDRTHNDFEQSRTEAFTGKYPNIPNPKEGEQVQKNRVVAWRNFCPDREADDDVSDVDGHGTQVAGIILRLAPHVQLYVARVCRGNINRGVSIDQQEQMAQDNYANPSPNAVEKAIKWAIEKKVHVINLSLGFRKCEMDEIRSLRETMHWVQKESKAVVFAATSNQGVHERVAWPARELKCAIGVHSCCDTGREPSKFSADPIKSPDAANFMVVGENILSQWPMKKGGGFRVTTGASAATPVASAIGALVLQFVRQKRCRKYRERVETGVTLKELFTNSGMTKVLKAISTERGGGYDAIHTELFWKDSLESHESDVAMDRAWYIIEHALRF